MACDSLTALTLNCGDSLMGGLYEMKIIAFGDLKKISGVDEVYTLDSTTGMVDEIGVVTGKMFVDIALSPKASNGLATALVKDETKGYSYFSQTMTFQVRGVNKTNTEFITSVKDQPVAFIVKNRSGVYLAAGLNGDMTMTAVDGGTGAVLEDGQNFALTFLGNSDEAALFVDPSIIAGLEIAATAP